MDSDKRNAQTRKQREDAKREAWKKERQEKKALEAQQKSVPWSLLPFPDPPH